ncbi:glycerate kinase type-2 family protein [Ralstonia mojiangensis]|uniref:glycerate kinase type-2 family protein n=1 Tax=Ralstonia mojiangensis TaxID=2953895 RepID=UPI0021B3154C|nr:glycerate kinase [Ralstonia mojiangensis]MCT7326628.1 glycerate kinase [Ralstonia mojiangensis]
MKLDRTAARALLLESYAAAVGAADPLKIVANFLPPPHAGGKTLVVGAGKAAASMALAVEQAYAGRAQIEGVVVTRYAHGLPTEHIRVIEAGHPVPDEAGEQAAQEILDRVCALTENDRLIVLVSGGGSSLLSLPAEGIPMADLKAVTRELLRCGAPITDMNIVRKHLSRIQGGRLAAASRAPVTTLIVSDVAGDDPSAIASGPTVPDASTYADALAILKRWGAHMPDTVRTHLERGMRGEIAETPKPGDACFARVTNHVIATAQQSLQAGAQVLATRGIHTAILGDTVTGEAREVAQVYGALARQVRQHGTPFVAPVALISGGECTVTIPPGLTGGRGGRCAEFLLSLGISLEDMGDVYALAADTDGIDGSEDNAGALLDPESIARAAAKDVGARAALDAHDAYGFFAAADDLIVTGPTRTNVNDYRVILIL